MPRDVWALSRVIADRLTADDLQGVSRQFKPLIEHLTNLPVNARQIALHGFLRHPSMDQFAIIQGVDDADPSGPPPDGEPDDAPATLEDVRAGDSRSQFLWYPWIAAASISAIAAFEGVGKTRLALDLARRIYLALCWPDGQPATFPPGTPTLWICSDGQQVELATAAEAFGLPRGAIFLNSPRSEPYGGSSVDDAESLERLERYINQIGPALVYIDSLTYATGLDLCAAPQVRELMTPLRDIAQRTGATISPLLHVAKDGQALGRRVKGLTRTILQLECPNPENPSRLKLSVSKSFAIRPPALGVTMHDEGNDYDSNPPSSPEPQGKQGRPPEATDKARQFIIEALTRDNDRKAAELCHQWEEANGSKSAFWRARDAMVKEGTLVCEGAPLILHLNRTEPEDDEPSESNPETDFT